MQWQADKEGILERRPFSCTCEPAGRRHTGASGPARKQARGVQRCLQEDEVLDAELELEDVEEDSSPEHGEAAAAGSKSGSSQSQHCLQRDVYMLGSRASRETHS